MTHRYDGIDPNDRCIKLYGLVRQSHAFEVIMKSYRRKGQPFRIVMRFSLLGKSYQRGLAPQPGGTHRFAPSPEGDPHGLPERRGSEKQQRRQHARAAAWLMPPCAGWHFWRKFLRQERTPCPRRPGINSEARACLARTLEPPSAHIVAAQEPST